MHVVVNIKNIALIYYLGFWLLRHAPILVKTIELLFPVRGHTFLPCERAFGILEKKLKKIEQIYSPEEYYNVYSTQGKVEIAERDMSVLGFKSLSLKVFKKPLPIKIQENFIF